MAVDHAIMKPKTIIIAAGAVILATLASVLYLRVTKWQAAYYLALAGKSEVVQSAKAERAAMEARHNAALAAKQAEMDAAQLATTAAQAAADRIRIRTSAEVAALRAAAIPDAEKIAALSDEVDARGRKIEGLQLVIARQRYQIGTADALARTARAALQEQRQQTDDAIARMQATVARALRANTSRWGIGPVVAYGWGDDGKRHLQAGIGITYALIRPRL